MMFDFIYRDEVKQKIKERMGCLDYVRIMSKGDTKTLNQIEGFEKALNQIYCDIDDIRTAEQLVKHEQKRGHWYHNTSKYISELDVYFIQACCSCCGKYSDKIDAYSQIMSNENCSHCGAKMDGEKNG